MSLLVADHISKRYADGNISTEVLHHISFHVNEGELVGICGASGSGKSTLLHLLAGFDQPSEGAVLFDGMNLKKLKEKELAKLRNRSLGFIFQFYHLLPELTALENALLPCLIAGMPRKKAAAQATSLLEMLGLSHRLHHRPQQLSGGEQQRVAIARAAIMKPRVIFADEPTGNLDAENGQKVWEHLLSLQREHKMALVVVSHNQELVQHLPRLMTLQNGRMKETFS